MVDPDDGASISVVTATLGRPAEVRELLRNLAKQDLLPAEVILVDGADDADRRTEAVAREEQSDAPFAVIYVRSEKGTAIQRNAGVEASNGQLVAFIDDDVRLSEGCLRAMRQVFVDDEDRQIGGVSGYRYNVYVDTTIGRWKWYRRLHLLSTFEPGFYDWNNGYPVNSCGQPPFAGTRSIEFMSTASAMWRREVFEGGLRFDPFFTGYGVLEDAQFSLRAGKQWKLLQSGDARCEELHSPNARADQRQIGRKCVVNYWYVFRTVAGPLTARQRLGFWRFQAFEFARVLAYFLRKRKRSELMNLRGRLDGTFEVIRGSSIREPADERKRLS